MDSYMETQTHMDIHTHTQSVFIVNVILGLCVIIACFACLERLFLNVLFVSSDCFFYFSFHSGSLFGMLPAHITGFVFMCVHTYLLVCLSVRMYVCACECVCLVFWPQSISQYRTSLFSLPVCSASSGSGTIMYGSVCGYTVRRYPRGCQTVNLFDSPSCFCAIWI